MFTPDSTKTSTMGRPSSDVPPLVSLLSLLILINPSLPYSLKNCTIDYPENRPAEVSLDCTNRKLLSVPDDVPRDAVSVKLTINLLERIHREDFSGMSKLRRLDLDQNKIAHVDDGSFIHLVALEMLSMNDNQLVNLTADLLRGMSNLTVLNLNSNNIRSIDASAFRFLTRLRTVSLNSNMLRWVADVQPILLLPHIQKLSVSSNLFSSFRTEDLHLNGSSGLQVLDVSDNKLETFGITSPIFPRLQALDLSRCGQDTELRWDIPDRTLLRSITRLYLSYAVIPFREIRKALQSFDSLTHLRLNYMDRWIKKGLLATVCRIPTLRKLDLFFNHLGNNTEKLETCSQLTELDLSITHIKELSKGSIRSMNGLRFLNVETNRLTEVPVDVRNLSSLQILNMNDNLISELGCEDFLNTTNLVELYLNTNRIAKLDGCVFENLRNLKLLDLNSNLLWTFGGTFKTGLPKLEFLDLSKNFLVILERGDLKGLQSLKELNMKSEHIGRVPGKMFDGLNDLETLVVSIPLDYENRFRGLPRLKNLTIHLNTDISLQSPRPDRYNAFFHLKFLKVLTVICSGYHFGYPFDVPMEMLETMKHLEHFTAVNIYISAPDPNTFQFNPGLRSLTFGKTDLSDLDPELFRPLPNLQALDLSDSNIKSLDFLSGADLSELRSLKLTDNVITVINETLFRSLTALTYLNLDNNPFTCDCSNAGFIQWVKSNNRTQVVNAHQYTCSFPAAEQGSRLLDFDVQSCRADVDFLCFVSSCCLVVLTLLTSFLYHFLRWQLVYAVHLFLAFVHDRRRRKEGAPHRYDAFVSYNVHDEDWVYREMLPVLEGEQGWRLCLHHRDFQPGKPIIENITDAIYGSRKTICVISHRYLQSEWCSREIQMASFRLFDEQKDVLVLLFLEDIPSHQLSPYYRMRKLVKRRTYLSWPQAVQHPGVFWQNVRRALETGDEDAEDTDLLTGPAGC
ncbi:toll-like receptor 13 [Brachyistius frenatus]|uniref:toll-like receptor 13 n=1 Tax=Brachyistius frenatus TaxID=100188 RepID=UPI0037E787B5